MAPDGSIWVDYIADVGDGFEATYTMAYLLAQQSLEVGEGQPPLPPGSILIMGGDQCYPQATREDYRKRLQVPYGWALDVPQPTRKLFAIPGNHDWYDGLNAFDSLFCSSRDKLSEVQGTEDRRLAMRPAPKLLGDALAPQLVDLGHRHPVLEIPRQQPDQLFRGDRQPDGPGGQGDPLHRRAGVAAGRVPGPRRGAEFLQDYDDRPSPRRASLRRHRGRLAPLCALLVGPKLACISSPPAAAAPSCIRPMC